MFILFIYFHELIGRQNWSHTWVSDTQATGWIALFYVLFVILLCIFFYSCLPLNCFALFMCNILVTSGCFKCALKIKSICFVFCIWLNLLCFVLGFLHQKFIVISVCFPSRTFQLSWVSLGCSEGQACCQLSAEAVLVVSRGVGAKPMS